MGRRPGKTGAFTTEVRGKSLPPLDPGALFHFWHPDREGVEKCPEDFVARLREVGGDDLRICRPPAGAPIRSRCWLVWYRKPEITHWLSPGWMLLIAWHHPSTQEPLPLDNRILAQLYLQSAKRFGNGRKYFDHIMSMMQDDENRRNADRHEYRNVRSSDYYEFQKIKNIGKGNKFARHHDGSVVASRGHRNWNMELGMDLPSDVEKRDREEMKRARHSTSVTLKDAYQKAEIGVMNRALQSLKERQQVRELVHVVRQLRKDK